MDGHTAITLLFEQVRQGMGWCGKIAVVWQTAIGHEQHAAARQEFKLGVAGTAAKNGDQQVAMPRIGGISAVRHRKA